MTLHVQRISRHHNPFAQRGVTVDQEGVPHFDDLPDSLVAMLRVRAVEHPEREAVLLLGGRGLSYEQLWDRAASVAGGLRAQGIGRGDRVAICYPAGIEWVVAFFGTVLAGGVAVLPNTRSTAEETNFVLRDAGVSAVLGPDTELPTGTPYHDWSLGPHDVAAMFYTSGTTGRPKGVPTNHEAFLTNAENMLRTLRQPAGLDPGVRTLISIPLFHVTGCNSQLLFALYAGGAAVIMPKLDVPGIVAALHGEQITLMITVPAVYALLLRHRSFAQADISTVRWVGYGGAPIAPSLVASIQEAFPRAEVFNGYGMTESAAMMTALPHEDAADHADSVGCAVPSVELGFVATNEDPEVGELVARGANIMTGYWNRPEENASTLVDGWLRTGDLVRVDDHGRISIVDRLKEIIIRGGENISSIEVEAVLAEAPTVLEAAVIGVPDDVMGEKVGAVVYGGAETVDVALVIAHCEKHLSDYKVPQYMHVVTEPLPRNAGGKLLKSRLRDSAVWGKPLR